MNSKKPIVNQWHTSVKGMICKSCYMVAWRSARSADEAALHRETDRKRRRLARALGSSASLEGVALQLHAEFVCVGDLPPLTDAEFASLDDF